MKKCQFLKLLLVTTVDFPGGRGSGGGGGGGWVSFQFIFRSLEIGRRKKSNKKIYRWRVSSGTHSSRKMRNELATTASFRADSALQWFVFFLSTFWQVFPARVETRCHPRDLGIKCTKKSKINWGWCGLRNNRPISGLVIFNKGCETRKWRRLRSVK